MYSPVIRDANFPTGELSIQVRGSRLYDRFHEEKSFITAKLLNIRQSDAKANMGFTRVLVH